MLTKMGYTPGTGLGPPTRKGRAEPLGITMRPARSGLGVAEAQQEAQEAQEAQRTQRGRNTPCVIVVPCCKGTVLLVCFC